MKKGRFLRRFWDYHTAMKILIISLSILLVSFQVEAIGNKKSKGDPKDVKIDSLTKVSQNLTVQLDSVSKELVKYQGVYTTLKEKVIHYNFDPSRTGVLIDSLRTSRDSTSALSSNMATSKASSDSIFMVLNDNLQMNISYSTTVNDKAAEDLKIDGFRVTLIYAWHKLIEGMRRLNNNE